MMTDNKYFCSCDEGLPKAFGNEGRARNHGRQAARVKFTLTADDGRFIELIETVYLRADDRSEIQELKL